MRTTCPKTTMEKDKVIPIPLHEQNPSMGNIVINVGLVVRGRLDPERLKDALTTLIVNHWPKLGARLKRDDKGHLELHIPTEFSPERPPYTFSLRRVDGPMPKDVVPRRTAIPSIHPGYKSIQHLFRSPASPRTVTELLALHDHPIIALHLTMFADVTCIGFSIPHCFADMLAVGIILDAWCAVLAGNAPPPLYEEDNILASFGAVYPETEEGVKKLTEEKLSSIQVPSVEEGSVGYDTIQEEESMLFVPSKVIEKYRAEGFREFRARGLADVWIGEHDVLTAMLMKLNLSQYSSTTDDTPHVIAFTANFRGRIPLLPAPPPVYLHNAVTIMTVPPMTICELKSMSVGQIALRIRETIVSQRTPDELERTMCVMKETARLGRSPRFFDSTQSGFMVSSWVSKEWTRLDFAAAVDVGWDGAKVVWHGASACLPDEPKRFWTPIISKLLMDEEFGEAGYWCEFAACRGQDFENMRMAVAAW